MNPQDVSTDSALVLAFDRDSVRTRRPDGQMIVSSAHITKANVCPYRGAEIPGYEKLGLDPDKIYNLLRDPDELKKAAPTLNGVQLLQEHKPVSAEDHKPYDTVGSLGSNTEFVEDGGDNYLNASLYINAQDAIDGVESGKKKQLSAGYHYTPDMTPGIFRGTRFDGVMRNIVFNHVALVEDGRAGPDVVVGDSRENLQMKSTRLGALALLTVGNSIHPVIAMDSKVELPSALFAKLTRQTFKAQKPEILKAVRLALDGKLKKGIALDATMKGLADAIDAFEELAEKPESMDESSSEAQHGAMEAAAHGESNLGIPKSTGEEFASQDKGKTFDMAPMMELMREKGMDEDAIKAVCDMLPKNMLAGDDDMTGTVGDEEDDEAKKKADEEKKAKEKDTQAMDAKLKNMVSKEDMKLAIDAAVDATRKTVAKEVRANEQAIAHARHVVKPWVGDLLPTLAFDSAADVYRHTLTALKVDGADKLHQDALLPVLQAQPRPGAEIERRSYEPIAMDSSGLAEAIKMAPGLESIQTMG